MISLIVKYWIWKEVQYDYRILNWNIKNLKKKINDYATLNRNLFDWVAVKGTMLKINSTFRIEFRSVYSKLFTGHFKNIGFGEKIKMSLLSLVENHWILIEFQYDYRTLNWKIQYLNKISNDYATLNRSLFNWVAVKGTTPKFNSILDSGKQF